MEENLQSECKRQCNGSCIHSLKDSQDSNVQISSKQMDAVNPPAKATEPTDAHQERETSDSPATEPTDTHQEREATDSPTKRQYTCPNEDSEFQPDTKKLKPEWNEKAQGCHKIISIEQDLLLSSKDKFSKEFDKVFGGINEQCKENPSALFKPDTKTSLSNTIEENRQIGNLKSGKDSTVSKTGKEIAAFKVPVMPPRRGSLSSKKASEAANKPKGRKTFKYSKCKVWKYEEYVRIRDEYSKSNSSLNTVPISENGYNNTVFRNKLDVNILYKFPDLSKFCLQTLKPDPKTRFQSDVKLSQNNAAQKSASRNDIADKSGSQNNTAQKSVSRSDNADKSGSQNNTANKSESGNDIGDKSGSQNNIESKSGSLNNIADKSGNDMEDKSASPNNTADKSEPGNNIADIHGYQNDAGEGSQFRNDIGMLLQSQTTNERVVSFRNYSRGSHQSKLSFLICKRPEDHINSQAALIESTISNGIVLLEYYIHFWYCIPCAVPKWSGKLGTVLLNLANRRSRTPCAFLKARYNTERRRPLSEFRERFAEIIELIGRGMIEMLDDLRHVLQDDNVLGDLILIPKIMDFWEKIDIDYMNLCNELYTTRDDYNNFYEVWESMVKHYVSVKKIFSEFQECIVNLYELL